MEREYMATADGESIGIACHGLSVIVVEDQGNTEARGECETECSQSKNEDSTFVEDEKDEDVVYEMVVDDGAGSIECWLNDLFGFVSQEIGSAAADRSIDDNTKECFRYAEQGR